MCLSEPVSWSARDVRRWLDWLLQQAYRDRSCDVTDHWTMTGAELCQLNTAQVHDRFPLDADYVLAELQLWKNNAHHGNTDTPVTQLHN